MPAMISPTWDILIATIPHRHEKLCGLLAGLDRQIMIAPPAYYLSDAGVLLYRDNLTLSIGEKRQALLEASAAEYVSFIDDDDRVFPEFVHAVRTALAERPDYVGFAVAYTESGEFQYRAEHSLRYPGWHQWPEKAVRDISHLNPVRRELALLGQFAGRSSEDHAWAEQVRASGLVREESYIPQPMYDYRFDPDDCHRTKRQPWPGPMPELPVYPWLRVLKTRESC
jgi:hypothetical protein